MSRGITDNEATIRAMRHSRAHFCRQSGVSRIESSGVYPALDDYPSRSLGKANWITVSPLAASATMALAIGNGVQVMR